MDAQGTVVVRLSTSSARIPLQGATVTITKRLPGSEVQLLAVRVTNFDGLTDPVAIETPPMAESRSYQNTSVPYAVIDIRAEHSGFRPRDCAERAGLSGYRNPAGALTHSDAGASKLLRPHRNVRRSAAESVVR